MQPKPALTSFALTEPMGYYKCHEYVGFGIAGGMCKRGEMITFNAGTTITPVNYFYNDKTDKWQPAIKNSDGNIVGLEPLTGRTPNAWQPEPTQPVKKATIIPVGAMPRSKNSILPLVLIGAAVLIVMFFISKK